MIGETFARRYEIRRLLGRGGMGCVYEAEHRETRELVALKVLHNHLLDPAGDARRRFAREAEAARKIQSEHIVRVLDAGNDEATGQLYLVTERLEGEDLQRLLDRAGALSVEGALRVASQALAGLVDAHAARVIHRDIKPGNLFLARRADGSIAVKILDFGIAKVRLDPLSVPNTDGLTTTGNLLGSPLYMSPEQIQSSRDVDHRTDLWSLGSVLYASLAGRAPYQHLGSVGQVLVAVCVSPPPPLSEVAPWVSPAVAEVVHRALAQRPDERYPTARAMLDALARLAPATALDDDVLVSSGQRARAPSTPEPSSSSPRRSPRVVIAADSERPLRGDEVTEHDASRDRLADSGPFGTDTLPSGAGAGVVARSGVPMVGARAGSRLATVDPRRLLGDGNELWTFSLDVHRNAASLVARVWKSLRRAGADVPPMSYGTSWVLVDPRTGKAIADRRGETPLRLEEAGIRPGIVLWIVRPEGPEGS